MRYPSFLDSVKTCKPDLAIPIALMTWQYERIITEFALQHNLITPSNNQFFDVPNRLFSPYLVCSLFVAAPVRTSVNTLHPTFSFPSTLWYNNINGAAPTISLDAGDGQGWQSLSQQLLVQAQYANAGDKTLTLRLVYPDRTVFTKMKITVTEPPVEERGWNTAAPDSIPISATKPYLGELGTGTMRVFYNCEGKKMLKPLIIVEGIEFLFPTSGFTVTAGPEAFFGRLENLEINPNQSLRDIIEPEGYDIIYVDWSETGGADFIQRNAYMIEEVIKWVNAQKAAAGSTEQNVVIGVSMGGVVAKYALLDMQNNGPAHDTRLFISLDAPLRGANIPIGAQSALAYLANLNNIPINVGPFTLPLPIVPQIAEGIAAIVAPATRQLLFYHMNSISGSSEPVNTERVAFYAELDAMGQLGIRHVAISNGADNGSPIENNTFAGIPFFTLTGSYSPCFPVTIPAALNPIPPNLPGGGTITITVCPNVATTTLSITATGNNVSTNVFSGQFALSGGGIQVTPLNANLTCFTKPYDTCPGGNSVLGTIPLALAATLVPALPGLTVVGGLTAVLPAINHHTFIPTFSAFSAVEPGNLMTAAIVVQQIGVVHLIH